MCLTKAAFYEFWSRLPEMVFYVYSTQRFTLKHDGVVMASYIRSLSYYVDMTMKVFLSLQPQQEACQEDMVQEYCEKLARIIMLTQDKPRLFLKTLFDNQIIIPAEVKAFEILLSKSSNETIALAVFLMRIAFNRMLFARDFFERSTFKKNTLFSQFVDMRVVMLKYDWAMILK